MTLISAFERHLCNCRYKVC